MPSGYTQALYDGEEITLAGFIRRCSSAYSAHIDSKDSGADRQRPKSYEPSYYAYRRYFQATVELAMVRAMGTLAATRAAGQDYGDRVAMQESMNAENAVRRARYEEMLTQVRAWEPPSAEHAGLKDFMIRQLEASIDFDCHVFDDPVVRETGPAWWERRIALLEREVSRAQEHWHEELARTARRNQWIAVLDDALAAA